MSIGRRAAILASTTGLLLPRIGRAAEPIRLGWLTTLTGPGSSSGIGFDRGLRFGVEEINTAGGVDGRPIEVITRDTQGDPAKCVNAVQELINRQKVIFIWGPVNSGESLAVTQIIARSRIVNLFPGVVDQLSDPQKYPSAFRTAPSNTQWTSAAHAYCLDILKIKDIAVVSDTTGYGTATLDVSEAGLKARGANVVGKYLIEAQQADVTADLLRMRSAGAKAIVIWSVNGGFLSRIINGRSQMGWDVPIVGHPTLGSGEVKALMAKPENWEKVYAVGYKTCSFDADGKLPSATAAFVAKLQGKVALSDTSLWWVASAYDVAYLVANAVKATGGTDNEKLVNHFNSIRGWQGIFAKYTWTPTDHNGLGDGEVVMQAANSNRDGAFALAPGYG
jgi:branched-chain amino acid transport system substrate-binding protein